MDNVPPFLPDLHSHCEEKRWSNEGGRHGRHQWGQHQRNSSTSNGMWSGVDEFCGWRCQEVTRCTHKPTQTAPPGRRVSLLELQAYREREQQDAFSPTSSRIGSIYKIFSTLLLPPSTPDCTGLTSAERGWAGHGSHPRVMAGSWSLENQYVFLSSLRELCLSLAITVCHTTERRGHTFSSHASFHPGHDGISLPHTLSTSKGKHVILLSSHGAKKAPLPPRDVYSSSADRSAEPLPSFIYLPIRLPASALCHLSPVFTT
ncbi:hypothetical protein D5F01_LYC05024 [Larimichthys crocea]|uniref:Uncharacterized protein n=1 Tax=Larimichthys crocea TaxID=215358 RepID=A0A6G0IXU4_LARCR|nr:hypothetical protein D5F01_LYC05024 [Larimichthys crocea]